MKKSGSEAMVSKKIYIKKTTKTNNRKPRPKGNKCQTEQEVKVQGEKLKRSGTVYCAKTITSQYFHSAKCRTSSYPETSRPRTCFTSHQLCSHRWGLSAIRVPQSLILSNQSDLSSLESEFERKRLSLNILM